MKKLFRLIIVTLLLITIVNGLSDKMVSYQCYFKFKHVDNRFVSYMNVDPGEGSPSLFESYESNLEYTVNRSIMHRMVDPGGGG
ncbi:hypothetical protein COL31_26090 [Bacillus pseudomycoides]|nr:hypothetical protein COO06_27765 [Bacillus pseudomycoides]PEF22056.1 hypothetical protein CON69_24320 [Bacillus pseudomycoides]PEM40190.1 hypothetical protein CN634_07605 [Bacillus pseudomycoides]PEO41563.1 hypothetical protein CN559_27140 [Bacillus pseudomycoides]PFX44935.1 hypothetical protein COL31_26090 [Bacillus pseudomycoides]